MTTFLYMTPVRENRKMFPPLLREHVWRLRERGVAFKDISAFVGLSLRHTQRIYAAEKSKMETLVPRSAFPPVARGAIHDAARDMDALAPNGELCRHSLQMLRRTGFLEKNTPGIGPKTKKALTEIFRSMDV